LHPMRRVQHGLPAWTAPFFAGSTDPKRKPPVGGI
jgi:hypothetical protein